MNKWQSVVMAVVLALGAGAAQAGDYVLELGTVKGEVGGGGGGTITVDSWSWGVHKAGGNAQGQGRMAAEAPPKVGDLAEITVVAKGADKGCVKGTHFPQVVLRGPGQQIEITDAEVVSCEVSRAGGTRVIRGHVTLIK